MLAPAVEHSIVIVRESASKEPGEGENAGVATVARVVVVEEAVVVVVVVVAPGKVVVVVAPGKVVVVVAPGMSGTDTPPSPAVEVVEDEVVVLVALPPLAVGSSTFWPQPPAVMINKQATNNKQYQITNLQWPCIAR